MTVKKCKKKATHKCSSCENKFCEDHLTKADKKGNIRLCEDCAESEEEDSEEEEEDEDSEEEEEEDEDSEEEEEEEDDSDESDDSEEKTKVKLAPPTMTFGGCEPGDRKWKTWKRNIDLWIETHKDKKMK